MAMNLKGVIQIIRLPEAELPVLKLGELGFGLDTGRLFVGGPEGNVCINPAELITESELQAVVDELGAKVEAAHEEDMVALEAQIAELEAAHDSDFEAFKAEINATHDADVLRIDEAIAEVDKKIEDGLAALVNSAPETLDTLEELANALGDDANFAANIAEQIGAKVAQVDFDAKVAELEAAHAEDVEELKTAIEANKGAADVEVAALIERIAALEADMADIKDGIVIDCNADEEVEEEVEEEVVE